MKTNINIFNNLNESLERELNNKRKSREIVKSRKERKLTESQWKITLDSSIRKAINNEDLEGIIEALKHYNEVIQNSPKADDFMKEEFQRFIDDYEMDFEDLFADDNPEEVLDYILSEFYDLCDNTGVFIEIGESEETNSNKKLTEDNSNVSDLANEIINFYDSDMGTHFDEVLGHEEEIYNETLAMLENKEDNKEVIKRIISEIRNSETNEELANKLEAYLNESSINESENPIIKYPNFYWLDNDTFIMEFGYSRDDDGWYNYMVEYWLDDNSFHFLKIYEYDTLEADFSEEKKTEIMNMMKEKIKNGLNESVLKEYEEYEAAKYKGKEWGIFAKKSNSWVVFGTEKEMKERAKKLNKKAKEGLKEEDIIKINQVDIEPDYLIQDVTVLNQVGDGDVQSPDIEALLTLVDSALKENYSEDWGHIKTLSSKIDENTSYALVDISTPEILKELDSRGIKDAAIGKNLILEKVNNKLVEFKVNNLNGTTKYSKKTTNPQKAIYEWIESEFLQEAKEEKAKEAEVARVKTEKETVENYINNRLDLKMEIENIKMFIELSKEVKAEEEMKPTIQNRMYAFAAEVPHQIEVNNNDNKYELSFSTLDEVVAIVFGKEWIKEPTPDNEVVGIIKESEDRFKDMVMELHGYIEANPQTISSELKKAIKNKTVDDYLSVRAGMSFEEIEDFMNRYSLFESQKINESYEQFNIGEIEVVFNPDTYETLYSIPSADVQDKKINLTKIPTVDTPYDTDTIIKSYIETRFGRIPTEEEKEMIDNGEVSEPQPETSEVPPEEEIPQDDINIDEPDLTEDELPDEPEENEVPTEAEPEEETPEAETGSAVFMKVRPKQEVSVETLRNKQLEGDTPTSNYIVVDTIDLMDAEFEELSNDLSQSKSWLEGLQAIDRKNYSFNVIKATNANSMYDILIDPLGYNYPRYVAIIDK